jgi:hypothetical protein
MTAVSLSVNVPEPPPERVKVELVPIVGTGFREG